MLAIGTEWKIASGSSLHRLGAGQVEGYVDDHVFLAPDELPAAGLDEDGANLKGYQMPRLQAAFGQTTQGHPPTV